MSARCNPDTNVLALMMSPRLSAAPWLALLAGTLALATGACNRDTGGANVDSSGQIQTDEQAATSAHESTGIPPGVAPTAADSLLTTRADGGRLLGAQDAMWVVMISDYQCPYCKQWHDSSMARFEQDYVKTGKVRFAYLHLPLTSIHPHALVEAEAAMCAAAQGRFWPYSNALFAAQGTVRTMSSVTPLLERIGREVSLDMQQFDSCRRSPAIKSLVASDIRQAEAAGVQSTPTFVVGEFMIRGALPYQDFSQAVDTALVQFSNRRGAQPAPGPGGTR